MIVRLATIADVSHIVAFAKERIPNTNYAAYPFNAVIARRTVMAAMKSPDARVWVLDSGGVIKGFLIGEIGAMMFTHHAYATDVAFMCDGGKSGLLLDAFVRWCKLRKVARIEMGVSATGGRDEGTDRLFGGAGFERGGGMYHMNLLDQEQKENAA